MNSPGAAPRVVTLTGQVDLAGFRRSARALLAADLRPEDVTWRIDDAPIDDLFAQQAGAPVSPETATAVRVPPDFLQLCQTVILHSAPQRFGWLYRMLWRLVHDPALRHDTLDPDRMHLENLARVVRRDMHKMKAFVRFRELPDQTSGDTVHVAWFEPEHHIVEATAPFFQRRFTQMRWAILTPERSVQWDGHILSFGPGAHRDQAPGPDAGEALWLTYYEHIFNPARLKVQAMTNEMPRRYWHNLPEATLIAPLIDQANQRSAAMIAQPATEPRKPRPRLPMPVAIDTDTPGTPLLPAAMLIHLRARAQACRDCPIGAHATQVVFGEGAPGARLMIVGEQPGDQEDLAGRPFVGPAGQLFERAVAELGWARDSLYVTNAVKHFKFELRGKRRLHKTPSQSEADSCLQWLEHEIATVRPQAIVALGATAARALLRAPVPVMRARGQWLQRPDAVPVLVTLHPAALLRGDPDAMDRAFLQWVHDLGNATHYATSAA